MAKSKPIADLEELGYRLAKDGYPTAAIENVVTRMTSMEALIVSNMNDGLELAFLRYMVDKLTEACGPASDDVVSIITESYQGIVPEGY